MAAYVILDVEVTDEALYAQYRQQVASLVASHSGRHLANTGDADAMSGDWTPRRLVLIEFPDADQAKGLVNSLDAAKLQEMRAGCVGSRNVVVIPGL